MSAIGLLQCEVDSDHLGNRRTVWLQPPSVRFRDALARAGHRVSYAEVPGGHDVASWRSDLAASHTALPAP